MFNSFCNPMDCSLPGSSVHGISQQRILERLSFPSPGYLPHPGIKLTSPALADRFFTTEPPGKPEGNREHGKIREDAGRVVPLVKFSKMLSTYPVASSKLPFLVLSQMKNKSTEQAQFLLLLLPVLREDHGYIYEYVGFLMTKPKLD